MRRPRACAEARSHARSRPPGTSLVDLSQLAFADASLTFDLAILAQRLRKQGRGVLLIDAQPQIATLFELVGLSRQPGIQVAA